jgi:hypothetical protein
VIRNVAFFLLTLVLAACATSKLDVGTKASIRSIYLEPAQFPSKPYVAPPEGGALAVTSGKVMDAPQDASLIHPFMGAAAAAAMVIEATAI